ncbi:MAG: hypothetical protein HGA51_00400 [Demequinaceae bacterium]|nr:hypothetical protein [Demequinaceae bacterium]
MNDSANNIIPLDLSGAKGKVEVIGALGIVARVQIDGERARPQRGGWSIPLKNGGEGKLVVKGFLPGFQRFLWNGDTALQLGAHVRLPEKIAMFAPFLLMLGWVFLAPISLALFLMNIPIVKNPLMPRGVRIALPIINTVAGAVAWVALASLVGSSS